MGLPDRSELCRRFDEAIERAQARAPRVLEHGRDADARPAVCVIALDDVASLDRVDPTSPAAVMSEVARRLDHLVRSVDLLGQLGPGVLALAAPSLAPAVAGSLVERITGAIAMPLDVGAQTLSLGVTVGVGFAGPGDDAAAIVARAEGDVDRIRSRG
jgi:GGDEF domain-containing protein